MASDIRPEWIAVDWGTSRLRVFAMQGMTVLADAASDDGMGGLAREGFEPALLALVGPWLGERGGEGGIEVRACGMVGSRQGWQEAPYRPVPCVPVEASAGVRVAVRDARLRLSIVPGLRQDSPADVMRGEEVQIAGAQALVPGFDGVVCLPGTHCKWAQVSAGEVVSFRTAMTGEIFSLVSTQSVLRHGLSGEGWDDAAFDAALSEALSRPERIMTRLFGLRAQGLLEGLAPASARAALSGLLIGAELAAVRPYWLGQPVLVVGAPALSALYVRALAAQGVAARPLPARDCTLAGLALARGRVGAHT